MRKVVTWNIGSVFLLKYLKHFGIRFKGQKIIGEYFQPILNGAFVSDKIEQMNPDILFLQEIWHPEDLKNILILENYPHQKLIHSWYHKHSILIASKNPFSTKVDGEFTIVEQDRLKYVPVHLNSFSSDKRLEEVNELCKIIQGEQSFVVLGDTNIWNWGKSFLLGKDKLAYKRLCENLIDVSSETTSTILPGIALDKILISRNINSKNVNSPRYRSYFMDHYPVCAIIQE